MIFIKFHDGPLEDGLVRRKHYQFDHYDFGLIEMLIILAVNPQSTSIGFDLNRNHLTAKEADALNCERAGLIRYPTTASEKSTTDIFSNGVPGTVVSIRKGRAR